MSNRVLPSLVIISDTSMWYDAKGSANVYEPTLREVEGLLVLFSEIVWIGYHRPWSAVGTGRPPISPKIKTVMLKASGGEAVLSKAIVGLLFPYYATYIGKHIRKHRYVHTRGPSIPALIGIFFSMILRQKKYWHKYAGNWEKQSARTYSFQKKLLIKSNFSKATINGKWPDQPGHILSFENPCFTEVELVQANRLATGKLFGGKLTLCFVGRLEEAKGLGNLLQAIRELPEPIQFHKLLVVGEGQNQALYQQLGREASFPVVFKGGLTRRELNLVYIEAHLLILPSRSEGFPKVVSEAAAFGCIPIVTNISSLSQSIKHGINGFLLADNSPITIHSQLLEIGRRKDLKDISTQALNLAGEFTYERFTNRIATEVFELPYWKSADSLDFNEPGMLKPQADL